MTAPQPPKDDLDDRRSGDWDRRLYALQRVQWIDELELGKLSPSERAAFGLVVKTVLADLSDRRRWAKRGAVVAGAAAGLGATVGPNLVDWLIHLWR